MILERFVLKYFADTKTATTSVEELEKKSKKAGENAGKGLGHGVNEGLKNAEKNTAASVARMESLLNRLGKAGKGASGFGINLISKIPGAAPIAGVGTLGTMAGVAAAALGAMALSVAAASREAKKAEDMYKNAWETSRNVFDYNKQMIFGQRLGVTEGQTSANLTGIAQKAMGAINQPFSEQAYWIKRSGMGGDLKQLKKTGDIDQYTRAVMEHARAMAKSRNESQALAWATNRMGADFETTRRYIKLSDQQIKDMQKGLSEEAFTRRLSQAQMDRYVDTQRGLETATGNVNRRLAGEVTPSLVRFTNKLTEISKESNGLISVLGSLASAVVDFGTWCLDVADKLTRAASGDYKGVYAATSLDTVGEQMGKIRTAKKEGREGDIPELEARLKAAINGYTAAAKEAGASQHDMDVALNELRKKYGLKEEAVAPEEKPKEPKGAAPDIIKGSKGESDVDKAARDKTNEGFDKAQKAIDAMAKYDKEGAEALQKSLDELKKNAQDAAKDGTLKEFINTLTGQIDKMAGQIASDDKAAAILTAEDTNRTMIESQKTREVFKAQQEHTQPVRVVQMPPPIGLEQAMSLWAAGVGKAVGLKTPTGEEAAPTGAPTGAPPVTSGSIGKPAAPTPAPTPVSAAGKAGSGLSAIGAAEPAGSRSEWEKEARRQQMMKLSPTYQPNALVGESQFKQAIGTASNVGVSKPGAGAVNITQHNTNSPQIKIDGGGKGAVDQIGDTLKSTWDEMTNTSMKQAVNELSDNWKA